MSYLHIYVAESILSSSSRFRWSDLHIQCTRDRQAGTGWSWQVSGASLCRGFGDPGAGVPLTLHLSGWGHIWVQSVNLSLHLDIMSQAGCLTACKREMGERTELGALCSRRGVYLSRLLGLRLGLFRSWGWIWWQKGSKLANCWGWEGSIEQRRFFTCELVDAGLMAIKGTQMSGASSSHSHEIKSLETWGGKNLWKKCTGWMLKAWFSPI